MNIYEAYKAMERGERVRHSEMRKGEHWRLEDEDIIRVCDEGREFVLSMPTPAHYLGRTDWQIVPRKETVGDLVRGDVFRLSELHPIYVCLQNGMWLDTEGMAAIPALESHRRRIGTYLGHIESIDLAAILPEVRDV